MFTALAARLTIIGVRVSPRPEKNPASAPCTAWNPHADSKIRKYTSSCSSKSAGCPDARSSASPPGISASPSGHVSSATHSPCAVARAHSSGRSAPWYCATNVPA